MITAADWRQSFPSAIVQKIDEAVDRFHIAITGETQSPRARDTIELLERISRKSSELGDLLSRLAPTTSMDEFPPVDSFVREVAVHTPIGMAAIHDAAAAAGVTLGSYELRGVRQSLYSIATFAISGREQLLEMHSGWRETGQGTGSSLGRDSEHRILGFQRGAKRGLGNFRQPKDQLALRVLIAIFSSAELRPSFEKRGSNKRLRGILDEVWSSASDAPLPSWERVLRDTDAIKQVADDETSAETAWRLCTNPRENSEDGSSV